MFLFIAVSILFVSSVTANLAFDFYAASCPTAELFIRNAVSTSSSNDPSIPGKLLRMVFHDCFVEVSLQMLLFTKQMTFCESLPVMSCA